jgi:hypothetical protein
LPLTVFDIITADMERIPVQTEEIADPKRHSHVHPGFPILLSSSNMTGIGSGGVRGPFGKNQKSFDSLDVSRAPRGKGGYEGSHMLGTSDEDMGLVGEIWVKVSGRGMERGVM